MRERKMLPVWFFVGVLLTVYGVLIFASGIAEWAHPPAVVLSELHAPVWWGGVMTVIGIAYLGIYWPRQGR